MKASPSLMLHCTLILSLVFSLGCSANCPALTTQERQQIEGEIRERLEAYFEAVKSNDLEGKLSFWSDSEDFVHAGDGRVFGNYEKWSAWLRNNAEKVEEWLYWKNSDIHVVVLSRDAAALTMNFENAFKKEEEVRSVTGSWTYVFRKSQSGWKVVMSNGTHIGFSYDE